MKIKIWLMIMELSLAFSKVFMGITKNKEDYLSGVRLIVQLKTVLHNMTKIKLPNMPPFMREGPMLQVVRCCEICKG